MLIYLQVIETEEDKNKFEDIYQKYRGLIYLISVRKMPLLKYELFVQNQFISSYK